jgi:hypothetical protein
VFIEIQNSLLCGCRCCFHCCILFLLDSFGVGSPTASPTGRSPACTANRARSTATPACCCSPSPSLNDSLLTFTLTWSALDRIVITVITFSPSLITHPNGWKPFCFLRFLQQREHKLYFFFLDNPLWGARNDHFQSWAAIHLKCLVTVLQDVKHDALPNNCLPS